VNVLINEENFTSNEAINGINKIEIDWNEQAFKRINSYRLSYGETMHWAGERIIERLMNDGFTKEQSEHASNRLHEWFKSVTEIVPGVNFTSKMTWLVANARSGGNYVVDIDTDVNAGELRLFYLGVTNFSITLNGPTDRRVNVNMAGRERILRVGAGCTLIFSNRISTNVSIIVEGNGELVINDGVICPFVFVQNQGRFILNGGEITGSKDSFWDSLSGGGVHVAGVFTMNGGRIHNNSSWKSFRGYSAISSHLSYIRGGGVYVSQSGIFSMRGGEISNNSVSSYAWRNVGGGVSVAGNFVMDAGYIRGNVVNSAREIKGGGVFVGDTGSFTMNGGEISANRFTHANNLDVIKAGGVGVYIDSQARFIMNGGAISNNSIEIGNISGGGVYVSGYFEMNEGKINNNKLSSNQGKTFKGGGVYIGNNGTFVLNNGEISDNRCYSSIDVYGGGIYVGNNSKFVQNGGIISNNISNYLGGGIHVSTGNIAGRFNMAGGQISGNSARWGAGVAFYGAEFTMTGGEISGNTADNNAGGVFIRSSGRFNKVGGIIYGNSENHEKRNITSSNAIESGHGIYVFHVVSQFKLRKNVDSGPADRLRFNGSTNPPTFEGDWDWDF
jgi:hypothetical protein